VSSLIYEPNDEFFFIVCSTISGPAAGQKCVLPFRHEGKLHTVCPRDPLDPTKFWCSTKVDVGGNHVPKIGAFGHCGQNCPLALETGSRTIPKNKITFSTSQTKSKL
jgi:hypothetical protein